MQFSLRPAREPSNNQLHTNGSGSSSITARQTQRADYAMSRDHVFSPPRAQLQRFSSHRIARGCLLHPGELFSRVYPRQSQQRQTENSSEDSFSFLSVEFADLLRLLSGELTRVSSKTFYNLRNTQLLLSIPIRMEFWKTLVHGYPNNAQHYKPLPQPPTHKLCLLRPTCLLCRPTSPTGSPLLPH